MKRFIALITIALAASAALAGGNHQPAQQGNAHAEASAQGYGAPASVNSDSRAIGLPSWGGGYSGQYSVCNKGWGFGAAWGPDMDCVREIAKLEREAATHRHGLGQVAKDHPNPSNPFGKPTSSQAAKPEVATAAAPAANAPAAAKIDDATRARARAAAAKRAAARPAVGADCAGLSTLTAACTAKKS